MTSVSHLWSLYVDSQCSCCLAVQHPPILGVIKLKKNIILGFIILLIQWIYSWGGSPREKGGGWGKMHFLFFHWGAMKKQRLLTCKLQHLIFADPKSLNIIIKLKIVETRAEHIRLKWLTLTMFRFLQKCKSTCSWSLKYKNVPWTTFTQQG